MVRHKGMGKLLVVMILLVGLTISCADDDPSGESSQEERGEDNYLVIQNKSLTDIIDLRVHHSSDYSLSDNLLTRSLSRDQRVRFCGQGLLYITVMRHLYPNPNSQLLAYTTERALHLPGDGKVHQLVVLDQSFSHIIQSEVPHNQSCDISMPNSTSPIFFDRSNDSQIEDQDAGY